MEFLAELRRRKVIRVAAVYIVTAWLLIQVVDVVGDPLHLPNWFSTAVIVLLALGFPVAIGLAWAFEVRPERDSNAPDQELGSDSEQPETSRDLQEPYVLTRRSVAVLPFESMSDETDVAHFASGLTEEILNNLSKLQELKVASRSSTIVYKDTALQTKAIGEELGVSYLVEGSVRRLGNELRITTQLIRVPDDEHVWAYSFERSAEDGFSAQENVARIIAHTVQGYIVSNVATLAARRQTEDARAYRHFRIAAEERWQQDIGSHAPNWTLVIENLKRATELDPQFAVAHEALANAYIMRDDFQMSREQASRLAHQSLEIAMSLRPPSAYTYMNLGMTYINLDSNFAAAKEVLEKGLTIAPNFPWLHMLLSWIELRLGRPSAALPLARTAAELTPGDSQIMEALGLIMWALGDYKGAVEAFETSLETMTSGLFHSMRSAALALVLYESGETKRADEIIERLASSTHHVVALHILAVAFARAGRDDDVKKVREQLMSEAEHRDVPIPGRYMVHLAAAELDEAFRWIKTSIDEREVSINWLRTDVNWLSPMRQDRRWADVMQYLTDMEALAATGQ